MINEDVLNLDLRAKIFNYILNYPGKHIREISRDLNIHKSTLIYHLKFLEKRYLISSHAESTNIRYFVEGKISIKQKKIICLLRQKIPQSLVFYLLFNGCGSQKEILEYARKYHKHPTKIGNYLGKHPTTLAFHLNKLIKNDIVEVNQLGNEKRYRLKNADEFLDLYIVYHEKLFSIYGGRIQKHWEIIQKNLVDKTFNFVFDVFPHPYYA